ncbi:hypothetical protein IWW49_001967 [Coemansia sp. RSA 1797]|nr:hypothetical protein IWW49_001967 [Coemansia sp. RSA 1797]
MSNSGTLDSTSVGTSGKPVAVEAIGERLRALRTKLEAAGSTGDEGNVLRAVAKELDDLSILAGADEAEERGRRAALDAEAEVHQQTLRLAYVATQEFTSKCTTEERSKVSSFYCMLVSGVGKREDEKLALGATEIAQHLRLFAAANASQILGLGLSYAEVASIVDRVVGSDAAPAPLSAQTVHAPKIAALTVDPGTARAEDSEFRMQVVVPPGGLSFIASAEVVNGLDEVKDVPVPTEPVGLTQPETPIEQVATTAAAASEPAEQDEVVTAVTEVAPTEQADGSTAMMMPVAADHTGMGGPVPAGFAGFGVPPGGANNWAATTGAMSAAAFGMMPLPYPPHLAMQCGYLGPHMYGMPGAVSNGTPSNGSPAVAEAAVMGAVQAGMVSSEMWAAGKAGPEVLMAHADYPPPQPMVAGYSVSAPFMYPHMDASNLSTAATGGSENTGSVHSVESASSRQGPEYPASAQYMWPQQDSKQAYGYPQQLPQAQTSHHQQQPPQVSQHQHQPHSQQNVQGYRRRGSGSNSSGSNQRDRRGDNGYHRQRWHHNQNYSRQQQPQHQQQHGGSVGMPAHSSGQDTVAYGNTPSWQQQQ